MEYKHIIIGFEESQRPDADAICEMLEKEGVTVFKAESTIVDGMSDEDLRDVTAHCRAVILLLTEQTQRLKFVSKQLMCALKLQKLIIPIKLEDFTFDKEISPYLSNVQQIFAYKNKADEITSVVNQLRDMIYPKEENPYSLKSFFLGLLRVKARKVKQKADEKADELKKRFITVPFSRRLSAILHTITVIATAIYIYVGVSSGWRYTTGEIRLMTGVPAIAGAGITFISSFLIGKIKNKIIAAILSVLMSAAIFVAMMLIGFNISQAIQ